MSTCPLLRDTFASQATCRRSNTRSHWLTLFALVAAAVDIVGWSALRDLLNAIPDSNDDFTFP
jgi:hypothetical protein